MTARIPAGAHEIHISDVRTFLECRRKWNWSSPLKANLQPDRPYVPFFLGRGIHNALQEYYENGIVPQDTVDEFIHRELAGMTSQLESEVVEEQRALMHAMLSHYQLWTQKQQGEWADSNLHFLSLETEFRTPLYSTTGRPSNKVFLAGRFDGVVRNEQTGQIWLWETKTARSLSELISTLQNDMQAGAYILAAQQELGMEIAGVLYNIMRKKAPDKPAVRQDGQLSQAISIDCTPEYYIQACKDHHPTWTPTQLNAVYSEFIKKLRAKPATFFARVPVRRTQNELAQLAIDLHTIALEMTRQNTPIYPSPSWRNCTFCMFKAPCLTQNAGGDVEFALSTEYRVKTPWDAEVAYERAAE